MTVPSDPVYTEKWYGSNSEPWVCGFSLTYYADWMKTQQVQADQEVILSNDALADVSSLLTVTWDILVHDFSICVYRWSGRLLFGLMLQNYSHEKKDINFKAPH